MRFTIIFAFLAFLGIALAAVENQNSQSSGASERKINQEEQIAEAKDEPSEADHNQVTQESSWHGFTPNEMVRGPRSTTGEWHGFDPFETEVIGANTGDDVLTPTTGVKDKQD